MRFFPTLLFGSVLTMALPADGCDLALAFAVDVSGSVDREEYRVQMDGLAAALRDPVVSESLVRGKARILLLQWTGASRQSVTIPWTEIGSFATLDALADGIATAPRTWKNYSTAVGEALQVALAAFDEQDECARHVIDLSGDGPSNEGIAPMVVRPALQAAGITVNAIAIEESEPDLTAYFFENVIAGEGAFVVTASGFRDYPVQIQKKLLREVVHQSSQNRRSRTIPVRRASFEPK